MSEESKPQESKPGTKGANPTHAAQEAELRRQAEASREALMASLSDLTYQLQPKTQAKQVAESAKYVGEDLKYKLETTVDEAREGDESAKDKLIALGGGLAALLGALILRRSYKRRC